MQDLLAQAARLPNEEIMRRVVALARVERRATVELVVHLAELDRRKLHQAAGYGSLFAYCTRELCLSDQGAYKRIVAARSCRRFPVLIDRLARGALNLSTLCLLAAHLTAENCEAVLAEAEGLSKREVEVLVARLCPQPDAASAVRKLPSPRATPAPPEEGSPTPEGAGPLPTPVLAAPRRWVIVPSAPERYRVQFAIGRETHEKLCRLRDLLRREIPDGDVGVIFDRALTVLWDDVARKKLAETSKARAGRRPTPRSRHIPAAVKRAVWLRDEGRCAFVARNGRRCAERSLLEFHHRDAYALGGGATVENIALRCREHNAYESLLLFGPFPRAHEARASYTVDLGPGVGDHTTACALTIPGESRARQRYGTNTTRPTTLRPPTSSSS